MPSAGKTGAERDEPRKVLPEVEDVFPLGLTMSLGLMRSLMTMGKLIRSTTRNICGTQTTGDVSEVSRVKSALSPS